MHRLLCALTSLEGGVPELSKAALSHLKVLRMKEGENLELFDGAGSARTCVYEGGSLKFISPVRRFARPAPMTLFACITKGSRWDWTVEKATELGVTEIVPVVSERTIVRIPPSERAAKRERWQRIAAEAARQSDAKWIASVKTPVDFSDSLESVKSTVCFTGALVDPPARPIAEALRAVTETVTTKPLAVYVGPEGDFTPAELERLLEVSVPVSFGSTVLRAETAAIYAISAVKSRLDFLAGAS